MKFWSRAVTAAVATVFGLSLVAAYAATTPTAPRSLKATAGDQKVTLSWVAPTTGTPDYYQVITTPADYPRTNTSSTTFLADGLTNGKTYSFAVRAYKGTAYGPAARVTAVPKATPPGAPTKAEATPGPSAGQYTITWDPPTSAGSSPTSTPARIDHYTVKVSPSGTCAMISETSCIASNIPDNATYTFSITATNSRGLTGRAAVVYAPLPSGASIGLQPASGTLTTNITVVGSAFLKNESIILYWDVSSHRAATLVTDDNGAFTKVLKPFATDKPGVHKICANVQPNPCARFTLQLPASPSPSGGPTPQDSPTPSDSPQASGPRINPGGGNGGINGLDIITRPPFVFLPIIGILGLLGVIAYWALSARRRPLPPASASVVHHATRPDYMAPFPPGGQPPAAAATPQYPQGFERPAAPVTPPAPPAPAAPYSPPAPAPPPAAPYAPPAAAPPPPAQAPGGPVHWPAPPGADEPPDLPEPSDS